MDTLNKVLQFAESIGSDFATPKQVAEIFGAVVQVVKEKTTRLENYINGLRSEVHLAVDDLGKHDLRIKEVSSKVASNSVKVDEAVKNIYSEIKGLKDSIPTEQITSHEGKFSNLEASVQKLSDLFNPESIKTRIESLDGDKRLDMKAIKGLSEEIQRVEKKADTKVTGRGGSRKITYIKKVNLTSQCNGNTKAFVLPMDTIDVVGVFGTQYPIQFDPSNDWTLSGRTLTLGSSITAPAAGQTLWCLIEAAFYGQV